MSTRLLHHTRQGLGLTLPLPGRWEFGVGWGGDGPLLQACHRSYPESLLSADRWWQLRLPRGRIAYLCRFKP